MVLYTKKRCGYCKLAKDLLDKEKMRYVEKDLDAVRDPEEHNVDIIYYHLFILYEAKQSMWCFHLQAYVNGLVYITRRTTVPQVFACGRFIGGYTELDKLREANQLWEAVEKCYDSYYGGDGRKVDSAKNGR